MQNAPQPIRQISLFDGICLIVGIMVGAGIYESSPTVAQYTTSPFILLGIWVLGGVLSLLGALTYATLGQAYPETGGDYAYLKHAFGKRLSFIYAWTMLTVVRPGNLGAMAYVFARYAQEIIPLGNHGLFVYAFGCIVLLSTLNLLGTREGKGIQNVLTVSKVLGLLFLVGIALSASAPPTVTMGTSHEPSFTLALIFVLFAYGGWNEIGFVAAEVKDPQKNLFRTLVLGTAAVTLLYLLVNLTFLKAVGFEGLRESDAVAHTIASRSFSLYGGIFVSALIAISALGAVHGMIFSGARIYYAMGQDHRLFSKLGEWNERGTPWWSILTEAAITLAVMAVFSQTQSGFESLVLYSTPLFYTFLALVAMSVFRLPRSGRIGLLGYPWTPILFLLTCVFMLLMSLQYAYENLSLEILWSLGILALGILIELVETWRTRKGIKA
jgi:basic amino acid/polyamine antiporter, APA family